MSNHCFGNQTRFKSNLEKQTQQSGKADGYAPWVSTEERHVQKEKP
jgi:hypothetical protein